jgi:hypothetical protein
MCYLALFHGLWSCIGRKTQTKLELYCKRIVQYNGNAARRSILDHYSQHHYTQSNLPRPHGNDDLCLNLYYIYYTLLRYAGALMLAV